MTYRPADPRTGELLKPVRPGVTIYSRTRQYADGDGYPIGGIVVDSDDTFDEDRYRYASLHWGAVEYGWILASDIDSDSYSGEIAVKPCKDLAVRMNTEQARGRHSNHLHALLAISNAIETRGVPIS
jgi:O-acetylhomoserine/O-acetylserine sulfhydrylase-like pyridoxal-dependent enzyme